MNVPFGTELWDTCKACNGPMLWMWGGHFWLHHPSLDDERFHRGEPAVYTEFTDRT